MIPEEVIGRLHDMAGVIERSKASLEASPPPGITVGSFQHQVGIAALGDDGRFLHSLAEELERRAISPAHSDTACAVVQSICAGIEDRTPPPPDPQALQRELIAAVRACLTEAENGRVSDRLIWQFAVKAGPAPPVGHAERLRAALAGAKEEGDALMAALDLEPPFEPPKPYVPFSCPHDISPEEQADLEREGRVAALKPDADPITRFTDGLGAMGVGSWSDGPASFRQRGFDAAMAERKAGR